MRGVCHLDFETRSTVDLKKRGVYPYCEDKWTEALIAVYGWSGDSRFHLWAPYGPELGPDFEKWASERYHYSGAFGIPKALEDHLNAGGMISAHNAEFEFNIWNRILVPSYGWPKLPAQQIECTMAKCAACALPLGLDQAAMALRLTVRKDDEGRALMLRMCKPVASGRGKKKLLPKDAGEQGVEWYFGDLQYRRLIQYCAIDVEVEMMIDSRLPALIPFERAVWLHNLKVNGRGCFVDEELVVRALHCRRLALERFGKIMEDATLGELSTSDLNSPKKIAGFLSEDCHINMPGMKKADVEHMLEELDEDLVSGVAILDGMAETILRCRQQVSKSSLAKYNKIWDTKSSDSRVRGLFCYHAATTGRYGGRGVQAQNLPKPAKWTIPGKVKKGYRWEHFTKLILAGRFDELWADSIIKKNDVEIPMVMQALSDCIRPAFGAHPDASMIDADFSAVEARGVFWEANDHDGLLSFEKYDQTGAWEFDPYVRMAMVIFNRPATEITDTERQLGKTVILGAGYGMGHNKFYETCLSWGIEVTPELAEICIEAYRSLHRPVKKLWWNAQSAAINAVLHPNTIQQIEGAQKTLYKYDGTTLKCRLPSGRLLWYWYPEVKREQVTFGKGADAYTKTVNALYIFGQNQKVKGKDKFVLQPTHGGPLTENIVQALCRDLLCNGMLQLEDSGFPVVLHAHDEAAVEVPKKKLWECSVEEMEQILGRVPAWAKGFPLKAKGWIHQRYHKE